MNIRPIFPYNSQLLQNLMLRTPPEQTRQQIVRLPKQKPTLLRSSANSSRFDLPVGFAGTDSKTNKIGHLPAQSINPNQSGAINTNFANQSVSSDWVTRVESTFTSMLSEIVQSFAEALKSALERSIQEIMGNVQVPPPLNGANGLPRILGQPNADLPAVEPDATSTPQKEKKKGGFFSKLGKGLLGFVRKGVAKLAGTGLGFIGKRFGLSL